MIKFIKFILIFILVQYHSGYAQPTGDSLNVVMQKLDDSSYVKYLNGICWDYRSKNPEAAIEYGKLALNKIEDSKLTRFYPTTYNYIGVIFGNLGKLDSAVFYYTKAIKVAKELGDSIQIAYSLNNIGDYYFKNALYSIALENIYNAYQIFEKKGDSRGVGYTLNDIGEIYMRQEDFDKALEFFIKSGDIRLARNDARGYAKSLLNQAQIYTNKEEYERALEIYQKAREYSAKAKYIKGESWVLAGESKIYSNQGLFGKALESRFKALEIDLEIGNKYGEIINYNSIGEVYLMLGNLLDAKNYLLKASEESEKTGHRDQLMVSYDLLRKLSLKKGDHLDAYNYLEKYSQIKNEIFSRESANKIGDLQAAFLTERKERENEVLRNSIEIQRQTRNYLILITLLISGLVLLYLSKFRAEKQANRELSDLNAQKDKMFSVIGHDLKNPAGSISNFLEALYTDYDTMPDGDKKEFIEYAYKSSNRLTKLLLELLEWGNLSRGLTKISLSEIRLNKLVLEVIELHNPLAQKKNIRLLGKNCDFIIYSDKNMLKTVLRNFISNSIKFTPEGGEIIISCTETEKSFYISTKDTGRGIDDDKLENLFKWGQTTTTPGTNNEQGTGLGLPIANEFVQKCGGKIIVRTSKGKGSEFIISLPKHVS